MELRWTLGRWLGFGILVLGLNLIGVGTLPLVDRDEPRFAEATREMRASGDWIIPMFNGAPRYDKPPMVYWLQSLSTFVLGESEWSLPLPSAMADAGRPPFVLSVADFLAVFRLESGTWTSNQSRPGSLHRMIEAGFLDASDTAS